MNRTISRKSEEATQTAEYPPRLLSSDQFGPEDSTIREDDLAPQKGPIFSKRPVRPHTSNTFRSRRSPSFDPGDSRPPGRDPSPASSRKSALEGWGPRSPDDRRPPPPPPSVRRRDPLSESRHPEAPDPPGSLRHHRQPNPEVLDPTNRKSPRPRMIQIRRKKPSGYPSAPRPPPSRREPSTAGSVHGRIRPRRNPSTAGSVHSGIRPQRDPSTKPEGPPTDHRAGSKMGP